MLAIWNWALGLLHYLGIDDTNGPWYAFWSGFGSDISEIVLLGGVYGLWRRHSCHVKRCWRIGRHPVEGTPHIVCRRHHPKGAPTHAEVLEQHHLNLHR